jgi:hypothetical protein
VIGFGRKIPSASGPLHLLSGVQLEDEIVWSTQPTELFHTAQPNISLHILNLYKESDRIEEATDKNFLSVC